MNFSKAKTYLEKINLLYQGIQEDNQVSPIERKLMLDYISNLYDCFWYEEAKNSKAATPPVQKTAPKPPVKVATPPPPPPPTPAPEVVEAPIAQPTYVAPAPAPAPTPTPVAAVAEQATVEKAPPKRFDLNLNKAKVTPAAAVGFNAVYNELFEQEGTKDLSQKLSERPISSLKSAWGVGDKFLIVNELFGKDISAFDDAVDNLNGMSGIDEARGYLEKNVIEKYNWTDVNKLSVAKNFVKTVRRRYV